MLIQPNKSAFSTAFSALVGVATLTEIRRFENGIKGVSLTSRLV